MSLLQSLICCMPLISPGGIEWEEDISVCLRLAAHDVKEEEDSALTGKSMSARRSCVDSARGSCVCFGGSMWLCMHMRLRVGPSNPTSHPLALALTYTLTAQCDGL